MIPYVLRVLALVAFLVDVVLIAVDAAAPKLIAILLPLGLALWVGSTIVRPYRIP
jgi:hypothetical protein